MSERDINPNRLNNYICDQCGGHIITKDVHEGTTPMLIGCKARFGCQGKMCSSFYRVFDPEGKMRHSHEWYMPTIMDPSWSIAALEHVRKGGLMLRIRLDSSTDAQRAASDVFTHRHKKRGTKYRIVGDVRLQISRPELADINALDYAGAIAQLDGQLWTLYQGEDGVYSARHPDEFFDGRFEEIVS